MSAWVFRGHLGLQPFEFVQVEPQAVWTVPHGLGRFPVAWSLYDDSGAECSEYVVQHLDVNNLRVAMETPSAGLIRLL